MPQNKIPCFFCESPDTVSIERAQTSAILYIAICNYCGAHGQAWLTRNEASTEWFDIIDKINEAADATP